MPIKLREIHNFNQFLCFKFKVVLGVIFGGKFIGLVSLIHGVNVTTYSLFVLIMTAECIQMAVTKILGNSFKSVARWFYQTHGWVYYEIQRLVREILL